MEEARHKLTHLTGRDAGALRNDGVGINIGLLANRGTGKNPRTKTDHGTILNGSGGPVGTAR